MSDNQKSYFMTAHRPGPLLLPDDPREAAALALAFIRGDDSFHRAQAIEALNGRISKLTNAGSDESLEELAAHLPVLEALFMRFASDTMIMNLPVHKSTMARMALSAQASYSRTVALIAGLKAQRDGKAQVTIDSSEIDL